MKFMDGIRQLYRIVALYLVTLPIFCLGSLDDIVKHYEIIEHHSLSHSVLKRSASNKAAPKSISLRFSSHNREFQLHLVKRVGLFSDDFKAVSIGESGLEEDIVSDHDTYFEGTVVDEVDSEVTAHYEQGMLTANIKIKEDTYVIEPAWRHLDHPDHEQSMIVYKTSNLKQNLSNELKFCGVQEAVETNKAGGQNHDRQPRSVSGFNRGKTRCPMLLVADYLFFEHMGRMNVQVTKSFLITLIDRIDKIFTQTEWADGSGDVIQGMGLSIKKIIVHNSPDQLAAYNKWGSPWNGQKTLEQFSRNRSHGGFCLAHLFTFAQLSEGNARLLGYAHVQGICIGNILKNGIYANAGMTTFRSRSGGRMITRQADLVTAHEIGHGWGSSDEDDDSGNECGSYSKAGGHYIMYKMSVSGIENNNKIFSNCSRKAIYKNLLGNSSCFEEPSKSFCGNSRIEGNEMCDSGSDDDPCCKTDCTLKPGAQCSDINHPCCKNCAFRPSNFTCTIRRANSCKGSSNCTGESGECPLSLVDDGSECGYRGKCSNGTCQPYCETHGMKGCLCHDVDYACRSCCRSRLDSVCRLSNVTDFLPDGVTCMDGGFCKQGICETDDLLSHFGRALNGPWILYDNLVFVVMLLLVVLWIPPSCWLAAYDNVKRKAYLRRSQSIRSQYSRQTSRSSAAQRSVGTSPDVICMQRPLEQRKAPLKRQYAVSIEDVQVH